MAIGRFIAVYKMTSAHSLFNRPRSLATMKMGMMAATYGQHLGRQEEEEHVSPPFHGPDRKAVGGRYGKHQDASLSTARSQKSSARAACVKLWTPAKTELYSLSVG